MNKLPRIPTFLLLLAALFLIHASAPNGCGKSAKNNNRFIPATQPRSAAFLLGKMSNTSDNTPQFLSAKASLYSETDGSAISANANIIWYRDSVIWLNVRKFGIEAARVLIRPDSVFIIYRLDQTYTAQSMPDLQHEYNLPAGFPLLEQLLLARAWLPEGQTFQAGIKDSVYQLQTALPRYTLDYRIEEDRYRLLHAYFMQLQDARSLSLDFEQYEKLDGIGFFPYLRHLEIYSPESGSLRMNIALSEIDVHAPKSYRFEIPSHYRRVD